MKIKADEYEFVFDEQTGSLKINRHGEPWRTETGDGALLALMQRCEELSTVRSEEEERAAFEGFYLEKSKTLPLPLGNSPVRYAGGQYVNDFALFGWMTWSARAAYSLPYPSVLELKAYDPGSLNDFGGGNVAWWQDYLRSELERAHDCYQSQVGEL